VCLEDEAYPAILKSISDPPTVLWVRGQFEARDLNAMAIVGSRRCSHYGREQGERFGGLLAQAGFTIVSGGARGVDSAAHRGALSLPTGRTVAVLGCGVDVAYPPENQALFDQIAGRGAVISEFPMSSAPLRENFPRRNRIISGLSRGVLVVEADVASGALITARLACDSHNRPVFAIPGRIDQAMSAGPHALIRDGAVLVTGLEDIIENLGPLPHEITIPAAAEAVESPEAAAGVALDARQQRIVDEVGGEPTALDSIIARTDLPAEVVMQDLTMLTLRGVLKRVEGQVYVCNAKRKLAGSG
jgi:DNA processing protein